MLIIFEIVQEITYFFAALWIIRECHERHEERKERKKRNDTERRE